MFLMADGFRIIVPKKVEARLSTTCFRGRDQYYAGNFTRWDTSLQVLSNPTIQKDFLEIVREEDKVDESTFSIELEHRFPVGYSSTDWVTNYNPDELEEYQPNKRSTALKVKLSANRSPVWTKLLTIVYQYRPEPAPTLLVYSIYPGRDIGNLWGNVTEREGIVFFDWNHRAMPG